MALAKSDYIDISKKFDIFNNRLQKIERYIQLWYKGATLNSNVPVDKAQMKALAKTEFQGLQADFTALKSIIQALV